MSTVGTRTVAQAICRLAGGASCVMDEHPERPKCSLKNCRMMEIARDAIQRAAMMSYPQRKAK